MVLVNFDCQASKGFQHIDSPLVPSAEELGVKESVRDLYRFFKGIPLAFLEAARLDGAGELKLFFIVAIPLGSPGVISAIVLGFLEYWNLIEQPMAFLKTKELWPLSLYLPNIELEQAGFAFAASVVALAPAVLVFLSGQDYLEQGIVSTAVKE